MKIVSFLFIFFISVSNIFAFSVNELEKVMVNDNINGEFHQEKIISGFPNPILTSGQFSIKNKELLWITEKPRNSSIKINTDGIFSLSSNGVWSKIQGQYDKSMFLDIVNMNFKKINSIFDIDLLGSSNSWVMKLKPKTHIAGKIFKSIIIKGGVFVSSIEIVEKNGDKTIMKFLNVSTKEK